jgi:DNA polymerase-3 subunit gamma/tau
LDPIFSPANTAATSLPNTTSSVVSPKAPVAEPKSIVKKKLTDLGTPSISQALAGNFIEQKKEEQKIPEKYAQEVKKIDHHFTIDELTTLWPRFAEKYAEQVHLFNTLSLNPQLVADNIVKFEVENSVQEDQFRSLKPEIIGFLRRGLNNSTIDVHIEIVKSSTESKILTDDQRLKSMLQKNPALLLFKSKFNLDFNS